MIINTHGKSQAEYSANGMSKALLLTSDKGIYAYCGLEVKEHFFIDKADHTPAETIDKWKQKIKLHY